MCGIAGIFALREGRNVSNVRRRLDDMADAMYHRGPDDGGSFVLCDDLGGMVTRRLAIRDPSPAGHMPMANEEETIWITYNGEIYNADELREELLLLGCRFHSSSDTEVILQGYAQWGDRVLERLRGIFALAIFDHRVQGASGRLLLARDRFGVKPLYVAFVDGLVVFASELHALLASGLVDRQTDPAALVGYLTLGYVPSPCTLIRGVQSLDPATALIVEIGSRLTTPSYRRYWSMPADVQGPAEPEEAREMVRDLLLDAVRSQLVSDVPLGAFLSGGIDSSAVVGLMRQAGADTIRTCSIVFDEAGYSEETFARLAAREFGAEHYERRISAQDVADSFGTILQSMDQPTVDGVNTYFVSRTAREAGLTVALSGLGGDELFWGYPRVFEHAPRLIRAMTSVGRLPLVLRLAGMTSGLNAHRRSARLRYALGRSDARAGGYWACRGLFSPIEIRGIVTRDVWEEASARFDVLGYVAEHAPEEAATLPAWLSRTELSTYLHDQLLRDTDCMSMAHSLEVRVPFLDHVLVEAVLRLPVSAHPSTGVSKPLLQSAVRDLVPRSILERGKQGFVFPFDRWLPRLRTLREEQAGPTFSSALGIAPGALDTLWRMHGAGKIHWSRPWAVFVLQQWLAQRVEAPEPQAVHAG
jgi:asparagine synthase (glutamine-hydrolysing)